MNEYILIVDDQEINRDVLRLMLEDEYQILEAETGEDCIRLAKKYGREILLVLLDLRLPDMNGLDVLQMRQEGEILDDIPVIVITINDDSKSQLEALRRGATDYVVKPFIKEIAECRIRNAIQMSKLLRRIEEEKISFQIKSERDLLTGLFNKVSMETRIKNALSSNPTTNKALAIFDIDNFKLVNDNLGHEFGDQCIRQCASFISSFFRSNDIVGRFGGDEFIVFLDRINDVEIIKKKLQYIFEELEKKNREEDVPLLFSVGVAYTNGKEIPYKDLFARADSALYYAKEHGKNKFICYDEINDN